MSRMKVCAFCCALLVAVAVNPLFAAGPASTAAAANTETAAAANTAAVPVTPPAAPSMMDALLDMMVRKGVLSSSDVATLKNAPAPQQMNELLLLLKNKGLVSDTDLAGISTVTGAPATTTVASATPPSTAPMTMSTATPQSSGTTAQANAGAPPKPTVVAAMAPVRVLPIDPPKREGLIPDIKLGPTRLKPYGFFKTSVVHDSSSPRGDDFPLPQFIFGDTGPNANPEFHIKARAFRFGSNFEWVDISPKLTLTGRFEFDFEGNFTRTDNRNVSSIRSSMPSLRLAWTRLDYKASDKDNVYLLFGQDWELFGSSTLPNSLETTGLGIAFGSLYERAPQVRFGEVHNFGGSRNFKFSPEVAMVLPASGNTPSVGTINAGTPAATAGQGVDQELAFGERQGPDSDRPVVEGRLTAQFQLDKAPGVAPAQFNVSAFQGRREVVVRASDITNPAALAAFPTGVRTGSDRYGFSAQAQIPTRFVTVLGSWYRGADLRWYFAGQLFSNFSDTTGLANTATLTTIDQSGSIVVGTNSAGQFVVAPQRPIRATGGFAELEFPLSRIFHADPAGHNAGWSLNLHYGEDQAYARDVRRTLGALATTRGARQKSDWAFANIQYKLNTYVTFGFEQGKYRTFAIPGPGGLFPLFAGAPAKSATDNRSEFATIFTF